MSDDTHQAMAEGDDAFGGGVGDALPGQAGYRGRHAEAGDAGTPVEADQGEGAGAKPSREQTAAAYGVNATSSAGPATPGRPGDPAPGQPANPAGSGLADDLHPDTFLAAERLSDLQRLQAEYVNYKKRVDRDRELQRELVIAGMIESLLPVLDEIHLAREHGELQGGPFAKIAEKLEGILGKYGVERFGAAGETFDPMVHQALMHSQADLGPGVTETTVTQVMHPGYKLGERVIRPAMVAVADPA